MSLRSRHVPGGLYFGPPAWDAPVWPARDPAAATPPATLPDTPESLRELTLKLNFDRYDIWTPALPDQLIAGNVRHIVLNLIPPQPESIMPRILSQFELPRLIDGLKLVRQCFPAAETRVAMARNEYDMRRQWRDPARKNNWRIRTLVNRYPMGHPAMLLRSLLSLRVRPDERLSRHGVILLDPITCWMLGCFMETGLRPDWRPVELFTHNTQPRLIAAKFGHMLADLLTEAGIHYLARQCILNGMMTGELVNPETTPLQSNTQMISIRPLPAVEEPVDCIRCGWCVSTCPSGLNPAALMASVRVIDNMPAVLPYESATCIECGLCSYVCPSRLPLAVTIRGMKPAVDQSVFIGGGL